MTVKTILASGDVNDGLINVPGIQMNPAVGDVGSVYFGDNYDNIGYL